MFRDAISRAKAANEFGAAVYVYDEDEYAQMRLFLADDGESGFALKGDELVSVFRGNTKYSGVTFSLVQLAAEQGMRRADAFDTMLPYIYAIHGLKTVGRVQWNDDYAPEGWDKELFDTYNGGEPDVVFMAYDEGYVEDYSPGQGTTYPSYDDAYDAVKSHVMRERT